MEKIKVEVTDEEKSKAERIIEEHKEKQSKRESAEGLRKLAKRSDFDATNYN